MESMVGHMLPNNFTGFGISLFPGPRVDEPVIRVLTLFHKCSGRVEFAIINFISLAAKIYGNHGICLFVPNQARQVQGKGIGGAC